MGNRRACAEFDRRAVMAAVDSRGVELGDNRVVATVFPKQLGDNRVVATDTADSRIDTRTLAWRGR
jgi:hypothetical protein